MFTPFLFLGGKILVSEFNESNEFWDGSLLFETLRLEKEVEIGNSKVTIQPQRHKDTEMFKMKDFNEITEKIIGCAIEVYKQIPLVKR
ncbi:MAG: hypothetical protein AB1414_15560 [bacterium]